MRQSGKESFLHDSDARNDERILELRARFGWEGYGLFWALIEMMRTAARYQLNSDRLKAIALGLAAELQLLADVVDACCELGLFEKKAGHFFSPSLLRRMSAYESRSSQAQLAANARWGRSPDKGKEDTGSGCDRNADAMLTHQDSNADANITKLNLTKSKKEEGESEREKPKKVTYAPRIAMLESEYGALVAEFGLEAVTYEFQCASDWLLSSGETRKNYAAFMRNWLRRNLAERRGFWHPSRHTNGAAQPERKTFQQLEAERIQAKNEEAKRRRGTL
jgi:hypothetical protein